MAIEITTVALVLSSLALVPFLQTDEQATSHPCPETHKLFCNSFFVDAVYEPENNVVKITYYLTERYNWPRAWRVTRKYWAKHAPDLLKRNGPHTLIEGIKLDHPQMLIEIDCTAYAPEPGD